MNAPDVITRLSRSLITLSRYISPEMTSAPSAPFHHHLEAALRDVRQRQTVVVSPRGHAKSSLAAAALVIDHLFFENARRAEEHVTRIMGPRYVVIISKTRREAIKRLDTVKRMLGDQGSYSEPLRSLIGDWGETTARNWTRNEVTLKDGSMIEAIGTGQQARGLKTGHQRVTLIVVDDGEDELNTRTNDAMQHNLAWLMQAVVPSLDEQVGRAVVIGTPINTQCMVVRLKAATGWRCLWYRNDAEANRCHWYDSETQEWVTYEGVLWPSYVTRARLLERKETAMSMGMLASYYREYEAIVVGDEDQVFKPEYLKSWFGELVLVPHPHLIIRKRRGVLLDTPEEVPVLVYTGVDPASSVAAGADKTAIVNVAVTQEDEIYVLPGVLERLRPDDLVASIARNHRTYQPARGIIETISAFEFVTVYLRRDYQISYLPDKPRVKKVGEGSRIEALQPLFASGKIWMWEGPEIWNTARAQLLSYPRGEDDWTDALEKATRIRRPRWKYEPVTEDAPRRKGYDPMLA